MRILFLWGSLSLSAAALNELGPHSVFGGQFTQGMSYSNSLMQNQIPLVQAVGQYHWYEPFCMQNIQSPWLSPFIEAGANYQISPYDFGYQISLGTQIIPHLSLIGHYSQNHYLAHSSDVPWEIDPDKTLELWNQASELHSLDYSHWSELSAYQSFGLMLKLHGDFPHFMGQGIWGLSAEHLFVDRRDGDEARLYDFSMRIPMAGSDELLNLNLYIDYALSPKWSVSFSHDRSISLLQSGVLSNGELFDPKQKPSLHLQRNMFSLKYQAAFQNIFELGTGIQLRNEQFQSLSQDLQMQILWSKNWAWPISSPIEPDAAP